MSVKVVFEVTSEHPCDIPVLGTFEAGETKVVDDLTAEMFQLQYGHQVGASNFPAWVTCTARVETVQDEEPVESTEEV